MRIAVIDHGAGNLVSIARGVERSGATAVIAEQPADLRRCDGTILPGVGTTAAAMRRLAGTGLETALRTWERPLLGICVGLQLFFDSSEEASDEDRACLGLLPGVVRRLEAAPLLPHIGWNDVTTVEHPLFTGIPSGTPFYFVHSFAPAPEEPATVIGTTTYGTEFVSAVASGWYTGVQFHPERSGHAGLQLLGNFVAMCADRAHAA